MKTMGQHLDELRAACSELDCRAQHGASAAQMLEAFHALRKVVRVVGERLNKRAQRERKSERAESERG